MTQENQVDQIATKFATLTSDQIQQFVENYAERIVDDMDTKCLMQFVYDTIVENLNIQSPDDILNEVSCVYDDDIVEELIESVTP
jgi:hypothetical protein